MVPTPFWLPSCVVLLVLLEAKGDRDVAMTSGLDYWGFWAQLAAPPSPLPPLPAFHYSNGRRSRYLHRLQSLTRAGLQCPRSQALKRYSPNYIPSHIIFTHWGSPPSLFTILKNSCAKLVCFPTDIHECHFTDFLDIPNTFTIEAEWLCRLRITDVELSNHVGKLNWLPIKPNGIIWETVMLDK